jgi:hypothetical protein
MERDEFIIHVYCLVCDLYKEFQERYCSGGSLRGGGFAPSLTDQEVITMELCGEYFKKHTDQDIFDYFMAHYRDCFPQLKERTAFARQAAGLWQVKAFIQQRLVQLAGVDRDQLQVIDTVPVPVCTLTRGGRRDRCFTGEADYGYCAAKKLHYYGFKLGLRVARCGMIVGFPLLAARPHDINHVETLVEGFEGVVPADKGFIDAWRQAMLEQQQGVVLVTPQRSNSKSPSPHPKALRRTCAYWRKRVETVGSQLVEHFALTRIRVHDLWHFQHRLIRKVLAHTVAVFLNLKLGRPPLHLEDLVTH